MVVARKGRGEEGRTGDWSWRGIIMQPRERMPRGCEEGTPNLEIRETSDAHPLLMVLSERAFVKKERTNVFYRTRPGSEEGTTETNKSVKELEWHYWTSPSGSSRRICGFSFSGQHIYCVEVTARDPAHHGK